MHLKIKRNTHTFNNMDESQKLYTDKNRNQTKNSASCMYDSIYMKF